MLESEALKALAIATIFAISVSTDHAEPLVVEPPDVPDAETVNEKLHDCPPTVTANVAVPAADGVPVIANVTEPSPDAKVPAAKVAASPVTPVDATAEPAEYAPPFPPVYGTVAVPVKAVPAVGIAEKVVDEQFNAVILAVEVVATSVFSQAKINNAILIVKLNNTFLDFINLLILHLKLPI